MIEQSEGEPMERPQGLMALPSVTLAREPIDVNYSFNTTELTRRVLALETQADRSAQIVQGMCDAPTRGDYDGLLAENAALRDKITRIELLLHKFVQVAA